MNQYTIYCTKEQTKKAFELGAPVSVVYSTSICTEDRFILLEETELENKYAIIPTTQQMIGWLEEQHMYFTIDIDVVYYGRITYNSMIICEDFYGTRKEVTLAAIDAALEYMSNKK